MQETANRIKEIRSRKGYSQEELAERSGLSLRTIQRIENGETEPRGDSLTRLAAAFDVTVDDLADWGLVEDNKYIAAMNLSALSCLLNPVFGILFPMILWLTKKDKIKGLNDAARELLNFQITWAAFLFGGLIVSWIVAFTSMGSATVMDMGMLSGWLVIMIAVGAFYYGFGLTMIIVNYVRASGGKKIVYRPAIPFIRK
jgi:transcriptional regulator with XRE-family HTH domain